MNKRQKKKNYKTRLVKIFKQYKVKKSEYKKYLIVSTNIGLIIMNAIMTSFFIAQIVIKASQQNFIPKDGGIASVNDGAEIIALPNDKIISNDVYNNIKNKTLNDPINITIDNKLLLDQLKEFKNNNE